MSYVEYKSAKHGFAKSLRAHAVIYEQNQFHDISISRDMSIKQFWKYVRRNKNNQNTTSVIPDTDNTYNTPEQQLTMWEKHFYGILNESAHESEQFDDVFKTKIDQDIHILHETMDKHSEPSRVNLSRISVDEVTKVCFVGFKCHSPWLSHAYLMM